MSTHTIWSKIDAADLPKIFPTQGLEGYDRGTLIPLFQALHWDFLETILLKMENVRFLTKEYFNVTFADKNHLFKFHINSNEDLDVKDEDEIIWAVGSIGFQWDVPWRSSASDAYKEEEVFMAEFVEKVIAALQNANFVYADYKIKAKQKLLQEKTYHLSDQVQYFYLKRAS